MPLLRKYSLPYVFFLLVLLSGCTKPDTPTPNPTPPNPTNGVATIITFQASGISSDSAITGGNITLNGDVPVTESGICYAVTTNPTVANNKVTKTVTSGSFSVSLKNLSATTKYYYRAYFINSKGTTYGNQETFTTSAIVPPPVTIGFVKKVEEYEHQGNPSITRKNRDFSFYYDNSDRLVRVGMKNYSPVGFDTATCFLYYQAADTKPYKIITPNISGGTAVTYDTVYFVYNSSNQIIKDSTNELGDLSATQRVQVKRLYQYPDAATNIVHWYRPGTSSGPQEIWRQIPSKISPLP